MAGAKDASSNENVQQPTDLVEFFDNLELDVSASGWIGIDSDSSKGQFIASKGEAQYHFIVSFAIDRETMKELQPNCPTPGFFQGASVMCRADIKAELKFEGSSAKVLVYEVNNIVPSP